MFWNKQTKRLSILLTTIAVGLVCGAAALAKKPPRPPHTPPNPAIVYNDGGTIWVMDADGGNKTRVLRGAGSGFSMGPNWSPDGTQIVFNGRYNDALPYGIYSVNLDGSEPTFLAPVENTWDVIGAVWSPVPTPDGEYKLLFGSLPDVDGCGDVFMMNTDGTGLVNLTNTPDFHEGGMTWAADGCRFALEEHEPSGDYRLIVYELGLDEYGNVVIVDKKNISDLAAEAGKPLPVEAFKWLAWANTQDRIAWTLPPEHNIWILDLTTYDKVQLTGGDLGPYSGKRSASWSPDDSKIVFWMSGTRQDRKQEGIYTIDVNTGEATRLGKYGRHPDWWRNWTEQ